MNQFSEDRFMDLRLGSTENWHAIERHTESYGGGKCRRMPSSEELLPSSEPFPEQ